MKEPGSPLRWPRAWTDPAAVDRLTGAGFDTLLIDNSDEFEAVRFKAAQIGMRVAHPDVPPDGVRLVKGEWPGVRLARGADASAGPTGVPWVDSNGWAVRLSLATHPESAVWVSAAPPKIVFPSSYLTAIADTAAYGGRWIVTLDDALAEGIAKGNDNALRTWKTIGQAASFFHSRRAWDAYAPAATVAVISDFAGDNEFFNQELLNLLGRAGQHYSVVPKAELRAESLRGLRAAIYADAQPPSATVRKELDAFAARGGLVLVNQGAGADADPYEFVQKAVVRISHRYDLVRFWNGGATGSYYAVSPDRKQAIVHLLFYSNRGPDMATVRIAGPYRKVKASMVDAPELKGVETVAQNDAVEVHLPQVSQYVALELSV
jgi:hypothetical protein